MKWLGLVLCAVSLPLSAFQATVSDLAGRIHDAGIDPDHCYHVRYLSFAKEDLRIYLTDGFLAFGREVDGRRYSAVFVAQEDGGDAEILLFPPTRSERLSLARATGAPNLNEHFRVAVMVFTDDTDKLLLRQILREQEPRRAPEQGLLIRDNWNSVVRNLTSSFEIRILHDTLSQAPPDRGFFYAAMSGNTLGNFDVVYDPERQEQIVLGKVSSQSIPPIFDVWTSFPAASFRKGSRKPAPDLYRITSYRIQADLAPDLSMKVHTRLQVTARGEAVRVIPFSLSPRMQLTAASLDGRPIQFFQRQAVRETLLRGESVFLAVLDSPLEKGRTYELEFRNHGSVILDAGNGVYYVSSRDNWYPNSLSQFSSYEVTFVYPKGLSLVVAGELMEESDLGDRLLTRRRISTPVRVLGFNLGDYEKVTANIRSYRVDVYANKRVEPALQPKPPVIVQLPPDWPPSSRTPGRPPFQLEIPRLSPSPNPLARLQQLATEIASAFDFMISLFGPPPTRTLSVSPIPGAFGQGFPGLVYLSTISYLPPETRPASVRSPQQELFFSEILQAHEVAHQWWGNTVAAATERDVWIMEALANYSALLYLEKRRGARAVEAVLADYRRHLLGTVDSGRTVESMGPIVWGPRLVSSAAPEAWRIITYEKGSWIFHMLRRQMGDQRFLDFLAEIIRRHRQQTIGTEHLQRLAAEFAPPNHPDPGFKLFFENWVYSTGIPRLRLESSVKGKAPNLRLELKLTQSEVDEDFSTLVPVEIQFRGGRPLVRWLRTDSEPVTLTIPLKQQPSAVLLDPSSSVLWKR